MNRYINVNYESYLQLFILKKKSNFSKLCNDDLGSKADESGISVLNTLCMYRWLTSGAPYKCIIGKERWFNYEKINFIPFHS